MKGLLKMYNLYWPNGGHLGKDPPSRSTMSPGRDMKILDTYSPKIINKSYNDILCSFIPNTDPLQHPGYPYINQTIVLSDITYN